MRLADERAGLRTPDQQLPSCGIRSSWRLGHDTMSHLGQDGFRQPAHATSSDRRPSDYETDARRRPGRLRRIWPAHVGWHVGPDGSRRIQKDRLDDQTDDQGLSDRIGMPRQARESQGSRRIKAHPTENRMPRQAPPIRYPICLASIQSTAALRGRPLPSPGMASHLMGRSGGSLPAPSIPAPRRPGDRPGMGRCRCWAAKGAAGRRGLTVQAGA